MNLKLSLNKFSVNCVCSSYNIKEFYSACNAFSYDFGTNIYLLYGEVDCGAWAFVNSMSSSCKKKYFGSESLVFFNQRQLTTKELGDICCYLNCENKHSFFNPTFINAIKKAIKKYNYVMSCSQLFDLFEIPYEIQYKKLNRLGMYYPCYLAMVGLIKGYKIFATSWQGRFGFDSYIIDKIANAILHTNGILFIPTDVHNVFNGPYVKINMIDLFDDYRICEKYRNNTGDGSAG